MNRRSFIAGASSASVTLAAPAYLSAAPAALTMSSWLPPASEVPKNFMDIWRKEIPVITEGRVTIDVLPKPLGPPPKHLGFLERGETDLTYSLHNYSKDRFYRARVGQFSFLGDSFSISQAFSRVYRSLLGAKEEHNGIEMLAVFQHGPGVLMLKDREVRTPDDFRGLRLRTAGGYVGNLITDLGGESRPMSPFAVAEALAKGEIDGVAFPYEAGPAFKVVDQVTSVSELPGGYYNATWFLGMSQSAAARLEPRDLEAIRSYSSSIAHVLAAKAFDFADYRGKETMKAAGVDVIPASDDVISAVRTAAADYEEGWHSRLANDGYDGRFALELMRELTGQW